MGACGCMQFSQRAGGERALCTGHVCTHHCRVEGRTLRRPCDLITRTTLHAATCMVGLYQVVLLYLVCSQGAGLVRRRRGPRPSCCNTTTQKKKKKYSMSM